MEAKCKWLAKPHLSFAAPPSLSSLAWARGPPTRLGRRVVPAVASSFDPLPHPNRRHHSVASNQAAEALLLLRRLPAR
jgi:hypothetical protein